MKLLISISFLLLSTLLLASNVNASEDEPDDIEHIQVNGTQLHDSVYYIIGIYYNYPAASGALGSGSFSSEYERMTKYSHCMSAAYSSKPGCISQSETHIEAAYVACLGGAGYTASVWGAAFTPAIGGLTGMALAAACHFTRDDARGEVGSFCDAAINDLRDECQFRYTSRQT